MAQAEYGSPEGWDYSLPPVDFFDKYLTPFIQVSRETVSEAKQDGITYYALDGRVESSFINLYNSSFITTLASGAQVFTGLTISSTGMGKERRSFIVDINGFSKPNKLGRDLFGFTIGPFGVKPVIWNDNESNDVVRTRDDLLNGSSSYRYQCNKNSRGYWCAAVIMADGWEIKDDYPW